MTTDHSLFPYGLGTVAVDEMQWLLTRQRRINLPMHLVQPSKVKKARKHDVVMTFDGQSSCATQVQSSLSHKATIPECETGTTGDGARTGPGPVVLPKLVQSVRTTRAALRRA